MALVLENAGGGSTNAAPVARQMLDAYLLPLIRNCHRHRKSRPNRVRSLPMSNSARQQSIWYKLHIDLPLLLGLLAVMTLSMVVLYSASGQDMDSIVRQLVRGGLAFALMIGLAQLPPPSTLAGPCRCSPWWC